MWLMLACGGPDPEFADAARALAAWERGDAALRAGRPDEARAAFASAAALRPEPVLLAWEARAAEEGGDAEAALALYGRALDGEPGLQAARWARALLLARAGRHAEAAADLRRVIGEGGARPVELRVDPAWQEFLSDPAYAFVPPAPVGISVSPIPDTTFWGSELTVTVDVTGLLGPTVVFGAVASGPVSFVGLLEEVEGEHRTAAFTWRVTGAGPIGLGPFTVLTAGTTVTAEAVACIASAPPGKEVAPGSPSAPIVSLDGLPGGLARREGVVWVETDPAERVVTVPDRPQVRVQQRAGGERRMRVGVVDLPPGATVRVSRGGAVRFEGVAP